MRAPILAVLAAVAAGCAAPGPSPAPAPERPAAPPPVVVLPPFRREPPVAEAPDLDALLPPIPEPALAEETLPEPEDDLAAEPPPETTPPDRVVIVFTPLEGPEVAAEAFPALAEEPLPVPPVPAVPALAEEPPAVEEPEIWMEDDDGAELVEIVDVVYEDDPPGDVCYGSGPVLVVDGYSSWACGSFPVVLGCARQDPCAVPVGGACTTDEFYDPCWDPRYDPRCGSWEKYWVDRRVLKSGRKGDPRREREPERPDPAPPAADPITEGPRPGPEPFPFARIVPGEFEDRPRHAEPPDPWRAAEMGVPADEQDRQPRGLRPSRNGVYTFVQEDQDPAEPLRPDPPSRGRELPRHVDSEVAERTRERSPVRFQARPEADDRPAFRARRDRDEGPASSPAPAARPAAPAREVERQQRQAHGRDRDDDAPRSRPEPRHEPRVEPRVEPKAEPRHDRNEGGGGGHGKRDRADDAPAPPRKK